MAVGDISLNMLKFMSFQRKNNTVFLKTLSPLHCSFVINLDGIKCHTKASHRNANSYTHYSLQVTCKFTTTYTQEY